MGIEEPVPFSSLSLPVGTMLEDFDDFNFKLLGGSRVEYKGAWLSTNPKSGHVETPSQATYMQPGSSVRNRITIWVFCVLGTSSLLGGSYHQCKFSFIFCCHCTRIRLWPVIRNRSIEQFSGLPYICALFNCLITFSMTFP
ncbi:hypothetical protein CKAN_01291100 [Cinnamomum micranthum f. kanehirae]|uniref:Uncharacterized protein n=1 Tax=Cinnamomum micranthum f. kanehirae TaxID=337451 RepID=A0A3S3N293_9MAGN|nr:hypothetical protein CKAN_01291100 [Cinnamomum micranthum f. kanehirae]